MERTYNSFEGINYIVAVGSVDGILTTAAMLSLIGPEKEVGLEFTQAFTVDRIDPTQWELNRKVAFVDLAVNNRDEKMTSNFVRRVREAGHEVVAVCDEHSREDWLKVLGTFDGLIIQPVTQTKDSFVQSSGCLLSCVLQDEYEHQRESGNAHTWALCAAADASDHMDFNSTRLGRMANSAVKSRIGDDSRRVYLARWFAFNREPDETIRGWVTEYEEILKNHEEILAAKVDLDDGIVRVNTTGYGVDMTTLMATLYKSEAIKVVVCEGDFYNKSLGKKTVQIAFGTSDKSLDLLAIVKTLVPSASGFAQKASVDPEHEAAALTAIRAALK